MSKFRKFQNSFASGLLSEAMGGRTDLQAYEQGCSVFKNNWPKVSGGAERRPGSYCLAEILAGTDAYRIEPFIFNEDQLYVIVITEFGLEIYTAPDGTFVQQFGAGSGTQPWSAAQIPELYITQRADVMFIAHNDFQTRKLVRTGATTFTVDLLTFDVRDETTGFPVYMPFYKYAGASVTLEPTSHTGTVTFDASASVFTAGDVGKIMRYRQKQFQVTEYVSPTQIRGTIKERLDRSAMIQMSKGDVGDYIIGEIVVGRTSGFKGEVREINLDDDEIHCAQVAGDLGSATIGEVLEGLDSGNLCTIDYRRTNPPLPDPDWDEQAFSDDRGWPGVIEFHSQRLWLGGSSSLPAHIFGSKVAAFFNFDVGDGFPDESIQAIISDNQVQRIHAIVSAQHMQIFTDAGEYYVSQSEDRPLTPENFHLYKASRYGSRAGITPRLLEEGTIFVQRNGNAIREFVWSDARRKYVAEPISLLAEDKVFGVSEMEVLYGGYDRPEQLAFFIRSDGQLLWYHTARSEQIRAWGEWETQGVNRSICVLGDKLYALVSRDSGMFLERFEFDTGLDCTITATAAAQIVWNAAVPEFAGEVVSVVSDHADLANAFYLGDFTVAGDGTIDLNNLSVDNIKVGFNYEQAISPMPYEIQLADGYTTGQPKRIVSVDVLVRSTLGLKVGGLEVKTYKVNSDLSAAPVYVTGMRKFYLFGWSERPTVSLVNDIPLPCEVIALSAEVEY